MFLGIRRGISCITPGVIVKIVDKIEKTYLRVSQGDKQGIGASLLNLSLLPLSYLYRTAVFARNKAYDWRLIQSYMPNIPAVISIGNIVAGGTGKTPVTLLLAKHLIEKIPLAILSRGYRSHAEHNATPLRLCNGNGPEYPVNLCGDEPYLLAENIPKAAIFVGKDRRQAADMAAKQGAKLIILDDGMQHRQVARNFEVIVLNAHNPFDQGRLLPCGLLREEVSSLKRAHLIVLNHIEDSIQFNSLTERIAGYTKAPVIGTAVHLTVFFTLEGNKIESLEGKKIGMFCAIGAPQSFERTLIKSGAQIINRLVLPDHQRANKKTLSAFAEQCHAQEAAYIVCTEKDRVKLIEEKWDLPLPIVWAKMELVVKEGLSHWKEFIKKIIICVNTNKDTLSK